MNLIDVVNKQIELNPNLLYMRGTVDEPADAVSRQIVKVLQDTGLQFSHVDIITNSEIASAVRQVTGDAEFPQLFIGGRYAGRPTVILTMHQDHKLERFMKEAVQASLIRPGIPPKPGTLAGNS